LTLSEGFFFLSFESVVVLPEASDELVGMGIAWREAFGALFRTGWYL
jgi:hypothetical protein